MIKKRKRLYLIDGANALFRAYYALPHLSNGRGQPTGALYGFAQMLLKLLKDEPDYIAVCLDTKEPTFRDELYADYKANRKAPPDDLVEQFPLVEPLIAALGLPSVVLPGYEADDCIGTLAKRFAGEGVEVVIVSADKDLMQLVGPGITMRDEMKERTIGPAEVREKFGVGPEGVVEVLGLAGDSSDNIPGVRGVGMKTAAKLIAEHGSVEAVIAAADAIKGATGRRIAEHAEEARLSRRLATIDIDVPLTQHLKDLAPRGIQGEGARELFEELGFTRLLELVAPRRQISYEGYRLITKKKDYASLLKDLKDKEFLSFDLETTSLDVMRAEIVGIALCWAPGAAAYIPIGHRRAGGNVELFEEALAPDQLPAELVWEGLRPILADPAVKKIGQNLNYDCSILAHHGIAVAGLFADTMLAAYLLDAGADNGLDGLARDRLGHRTIRYEEVVGKGKAQRNFAEVSPQEARDYACEDADVALRLAEALLPELADEGLAALYQELEMPLVEVLVAMQLAGVKVDPERLRQIGEEFTKRLADLEQRIHAAAGEPFNINSPKQLGAILFEKLGLAGGKRTKTGFSTNQAVLEKLAAEHELPRLVLDYRSLAKLSSTYVDALTKLIHSESGRVHTSFNQARTATGRLSSSDPNLQNIPARGEEGRRIRAAFVAEEGNALMSADYSQIELRLLAHCSEDAALIAAFREGLDVHAMTASGIFGVAPEAVTREQRATGKTVNFSVIYGQTAYGLARQLGITPDEAASYIDEYFRTYPGVAAYRDAVIARAKEEGRVSTLFGRRRLLPDLTSTNAQVAQFAERAAFNTVLQGSAADIIKRAMIVIHRELPTLCAEARMILQVHDELLFELPVEERPAMEAFVRERMEGAAELAVPLIVDINSGSDWSTAHP